MNTCTRRAAFAKQSTVALALWVSTSMISACTLFWLTYIHVTCLLIVFHYDKTHVCNIQRFLQLLKTILFQLKLFYIFSYFGQNIDCGYTLELSQLLYSKSSHNVCFRAKIRKVTYTPLHPRLTI